VLSFYTNSGDDYVSTITYRHPDTDAMTDLFMDSYFSTIKSAMGYLNPSGELVKPLRSVITAGSTPAPIVDATNVQVSRNEEKGGIEIRFPNKPNDSILASLHDKGFNWSRFNKVWWIKYDATIYQWALETFMREPEMVTT
jgi:hypothetical protein